MTAFLVLFASHLLVAIVSFAFGVMVIQGQDAVIAAKRMDRAWKKKRAKVDR